MEIKLENRNQGIGQNLFADQDFSDVTLVCTDKRLLTVHKCILSASSIFFRTLLYESIHQTTFLYLGGFHYRDINLLVQWMYLGHCEVEEELIEDLLKVAEDLGVEDLVNALQKIRQGKVVLKNENGFIDFALDGAEEDIVNLREEIGNNQFKSVEFVPTTVDIVDKIVVKTDLDVIQSVEKVTQTVGTFNDVRNDNSCNVEQFKGKVEIFNPHEILSSETMISLKDDKVNVDNIKKEKMHKKKKPFTLPSIIIPLPNDIGIYICPTCSKELNTPYKIRLHIAVKHEGFTYDCDKCIMQFYHLDALKNHQKKLHEGIIFTCEKCSKKFFTITGKQSHQSKETTCPKCDFKTCNRWLLSKNGKHGKTHHPFYKNGKFWCNKCEYSSSKLI